MGALVREAVALSGLEGLGVPRVVGVRRAAGRAPVHGARARRGAEPRGRARTSRRAARRGSRRSPRACDQLTVVHRAGLLHGDIKPANIIVGRRRPRHAGRPRARRAVARGRHARRRGSRRSTPRPSSSMGEPLTVRAEVYALGATLAEALARRGGPLDGATRAALGEGRGARHGEGPERCAGRASTSSRAPCGAPRTCRPPRRPRSRRGPSSASTPRRSRCSSWCARSGRARPSRSRARRGRAGRRSCGASRGRSAWKGSPSRRSSARERPRDARGGRARARAARGERLRSSWSTTATALDEAEPRRPAKCADARARGSSSWVARRRREALARSEPPFVRGAAARRPTTPRSSCARAVPSLPRRLRAHLVERIDGRPGPLRASRTPPVGPPHRVAARTSTPPSTAPATPSVAPGSSPRLHARPSSIARSTRDASTRRRSSLDGPGARCPARGEGERVRLALARARIAIGRGDTAGAHAALAGVKDAALAGPHARPWQLLRARAALRGGDYAGRGGARRRGARRTARGDAVAADALSVRGVALAFTGEDTAARAALERGHPRSRATTGEARVEAVALGSPAIAHQRAGRTAAARTAYEASLAAAEEASDAATVATTRLNLAGIAQSRRRSRAGARAPRGGGRHGPPIGQRRGGDAGAPQPREPRPLPRAVGARARRRSTRSSRGATELSRGGAGAAPRARGRARGAHRRRRPRGAASTRRRATAWDAQGRPHDAAEARLEGLLARARERRRRAPRCSRRELEAVRTALGRGRASASTRRSPSSCAATIALRGRRRGRRRGARSTRPSSRATKDGAARVGVAGARRPRAARRVARAARPPRGATPRRRSRCSRRRRRSSRATCARCSGTTRAGAALREAHAATIAAPRRRRTASPSAARRPAGDAVGGTTSIFTRTASRRGSPRAHPRDHARARDRARPPAPPRSG